MLGPPRVLEMAALAPLRVTSTQRKFDISVKVIMVLAPAAMQAPSCTASPVPSSSTTRTSGPP